MRYTPRHKKRSAVVAAVGISAIAGVVALGGVPAQAASVSTWDQIAQCESGGQWSLDGGDADSTGGLQIQTRTWVDFGGTAYAPTAGQATKSQQIAIAEKILASQGPSAWAVTVNGSACNGVSLTTGGSGPAPEESAPAQQEAPQAAPENRQGDGERNRGDGGGRGDQNRTWQHHDEAPAPAPAAASGGTYTVVAGDTLSGIAGGNDWHALYEANIGVIGGDPDVIEIGQVLTLV
jgi:hypothetical protein